MIALDITRSIPGRSAALALVVEIILATVIVLIFGEVVPKVFAIKYAEKYSTVIAIPIGFLKSFYSGC